MIESFVFLIRIRTACPTAWSLAVSYTALCLRKRRQTDVVEWANQREYHVKLVSDFFSLLLRFLPFFYFSFLFSVYFLFLFFALFKLKVPAGTPYSIASSSGVARECEKQQFVTLPRTSSSNFAVTT